MGGRVRLCDHTLCEGPRPLVNGLSESSRLRFIGQLDRCGIGEIVLVSPDRVADEVRFSRRVKAEGFDITLAGQVYASSPDFEPEIEQTTEVLDRIDLLMPLSSHQPPLGGGRKISVLLDALDFARSRSTQIGVGFLFATEASPLFLLEIVQRTIRAGAQRITLYDTAGESEPFALRTMLEELIAEVGVPVFFQASDRLGLAVANSWAAVLAGARGLGVTVGGSRYGAHGTAVERLAELLDRNRIPTGIDMHELQQLGPLLES